MSTFANSEDPDEIIAEIKTIKREEIHHNLKILTCNPWICTMNHPKFNIHYVALQNL